MPGGKRTLTGRVVSNKMDKTIIVEVETSKRHPLYRRTIRIRKRYKAHDENNSCSEGDVVSIVEHRPISKDKRWLVREVVGHLEPQDIAENEIDTGVDAEVVTVVVQENEIDTGAAVAEVEEVEEEAVAEEDDDDGDDADDEVADGDDEDDEGEDDDEDDDKDKKR